MKQFLSILFLLITIQINAQILNPVKWNFSAKKISDKTYEMHLTAAIEKPWHIYSQTTLAGGPIPTKITLNKNPLITISGKAKENGKLIKKYEEVFGIDVNYFENKVDFVQTVKLWSNAKTKLSGTIEYMICTNEKCLPPKTIQFNISLR